MKKREIRKKLDKGETVEIVGPKNKEGDVDHDTPWGPIEVVDMIGKPCRECGGVSTDGRTCDRCGIRGRMLSDSWAQRIRRPD